MALKTDRKEEDHNTSCVVIKNMDWTSCETYEITCQKTSREKLRLERRGCRRDAGLDYQRRTLIFAVGSGSLI